MKTVLTKKTFVRMTLVTIIVIFALFLGTCTPELLPEGEAGGGLEWTDVEYNITSTGEVSTIKFHLRPDGVEGQPGPGTYGVPVTPKQRAIKRALSKDTAAASHDYFEAVFVRSGGTETTREVVRVTWEIGYPAGISGGSQGLALPAASATTGKDFTPLFPAGTAATNLASTVFVGTKRYKTLLGVGVLKYVDDVTTNLTNLKLGATSITFEVYPLLTWLGFQDASTPVGHPYTVQRRAVKATGVSDLSTGVYTFGGATNVTALPTDGKEQTFTPVKGSTDSVYYPLYTRTGAAGAAQTVTYTVGGIGTVLSAIRVYGSREATPPTPKGGIHVIKRKPTFMFQGRAYEAGSTYDSFTSISQPTVNVTHGNAFVDEIPFTYTPEAQSSGIFAITWQCPVYAISINEGEDTSKFTKWFIRPADGPNLYLLDSGWDEGGMVMIGDVQSLTDDWIEIKTIGIGFDNN